MSELYNKAAERLWEKVEFGREGFNMDCLDDKLVFPWDQFCKANPNARKLATEVNSELNYELSEAQCSWAVMMSYRKIDMDKYNADNSTSLRPRQ